MRRLALVPFLYTVGTRIATPRDLIYLVASSWIPGLWILVRLGGETAFEAVPVYAAGFLAFISVYEIGYLVNDAWDAARGKARRRVAFALGPRFIAAFVAIRLAVWGGIGWLAGWILDPAWLLAYATLAVAVAAHNLVPRAALRPATFFQLACLRFTIPVMGGIDTGDLPLVLLVAVLFYTYFRFLSYLDSKDLLAMDERRHPGFGFTQVMLMAPFTLFLGYASGEWLLVEMLGYFATLYGLYALVGRRR